MFKVKNSIGPEIMNEIFVTKNTVNVRQLRSQTDFFIPQVNTVHFGHDSLRYFGPKLWEIIPKEIRGCQTLEDFKLKIKKWNPSQCSCRLCKQYIGGYGFI